MTRTRTRPPQRPVAFPWLTFYIASSGKTQGEIGAEAGMSDNRISGIVRGRIAPTLADRLALAAVLGVADGDLFPDLPPLDEAEPVAAQT